jgi:HEAT repeat protein
VRAAHERTRRILTKEDPKELTAQDWADIRAMIGDQNWLIRMKGLTALRAFAGSAYSSEAWQLALGHLTDPESVPRVYAASAAAILRPDEAAWHIAPLLQDPDKLTRDAVKGILSRLGYSTK